MPNEHTIECSNPACNCMVTAVIDVDTFCSDSCGAAEQAEERNECACGHSPCDA